MTDEEMRQFITETVEQAVTSMLRPTVTRDQIMSIKDTATRQEMIARHPEAFDPANLPEEQQVVMELAEKRRRKQEEDPAFESWVEEKAAEIAALETPKERREAIFSIPALNQARGATLRKRLIERFADDFQDYAPKDPWKQASPKPKRAESPLVTKARKKIEGIADADERRSAILNIKDTATRQTMIGENPALFVAGGEPNE